MTYDPIDTSASDDSADSTVTVDDIDTTVLQGLNLDDAPAGGEVRITEENGDTVFSAQTFLDALIADDFADSKTSNRDDFNTTSFADASTLVSGPSNYQTASRPEYTITAGSVSFSSGRIQFDQSPTTLGIDVDADFSNNNFGINDQINVDFRVEDGNGFTGFGVSEESHNTLSQSSFIDAPINSVAFFFDGNNNDGVRFTETDGSGQLDDQRTGYGGSQTDASFEIEIDWDGTNLNFFAEKLDSNDTVSYSTSNIEPDTIKSVFLHGFGSSQKVEYFVLY